jgi:hypothetical protein
MSAHSDTPHHDNSEGSHSLVSPNSHFSIPYDPPAHGSSVPNQYSLKHRPPPPAAFQPGSIPTLSRKFVARRISEGETGRLKEELKCQACGKGYKHVSSLAKHLWEHTPEWNMTSKLLISKHQQVQLLEAASILVSMNEEDEDADSTADSTTTTDSAVNSYTPGSSEDTSPSPPPAGLSTQTSEFFLSASPSVPNVPGIPMATSNRSVSKTSSSASYHRRSSLSARRSSLSSPASSLLAARSPVTDSLLTDAIYGSSLSSSLSTIRILHDDYELLASPNRARRMSHLRHTHEETGDLSPPEDKSPPDYGRNDHDSPSVFGDMDD